MRSSSAVTPSFASSRKTMTGEVSMANCTCASVAATICARGFPALEADAAGVEQGVVAVRHFGGDDVARHAGLVMHDGDALPRQPVEEAAFADIGPADDGDSAGHGPSSE